MDRSNIVIYAYHLYCKKGCSLEYVVETDIKNLPKTMKPTCPKCGRRIYIDEEKTEIIGPLRAKPKYKRKKTNIDDEIANRQEHKKANDGRRRKKKKVA